MLPNRFKMTHGCSENLKLLKARTGVTPNIMCRLGLMLSLQRGATAGERVLELDGVELNAHTLFGDDIQVYETLLRQIHGDIDGKDIAKVIAAHVDYGVEELKKCKTLLELSDFIDSRVAAQ